MTDKNLIFLISQPRSGSTLTQKILGTNSEVYTRGEPWLMLHPAYLLKKGNLKSVEYDATLEEKALREFFDGLPNKKQTYLNSLKNMYLSIYGEYLQLSNKKYFLDKTPRYHLIINELNQIFPQSKQVILVRNPLAVLNSLIPRKKFLFQLSDNKHDLITAIDNLIKVIKKPNSNQIIIKYEDILQRPERSIEKLCVFLNIKYDDKMIESFSSTSEKWKFGDQKIYEKDKIDNANDNKWVERLSDPQHWRLIYDYLLLLGKEKIQILGYDYNELYDTLKMNNPMKEKKSIFDKTVSLDVFLNNERDKFFENIALKAECFSKESVIMEQERKLIEQERKLIERNDLLKRRTKRLNRILTSKSYKLYKLIKNIFQKD